MTVSVSAADMSQLMLETAMLIGIAGPGRAEVTKVAPGTDPPSAVLEVSYEGVDDLLEVLSEWAAERQ